MALEPGTQVTDNVRLVRPLGKGGMGDVWVGENSALETEVAVKFIDRDVVAQKPKLLKRFRREASLCAKLTSPHVVRTFDHGVMEDGTPYIVMELLEGETVAQRIERGPMSPRLVGLLVQQVCGVLQQAHKLGVVHRDIKPDNLFLIESEYELFTKVLDFGVAKEADAPTTLTETGALIGTPYYMSPEQLMGEPADGRADLWGLGVVSYEALCGKLPFRGDTVPKLSMRIFSDPHKPISKRLKNAPEALDAWFDKMLAKKATDRFASAAAATKAYEASLHGDDDAFQSAAEKSYSVPPSGALASGNEEIADTVAADDSARHKTLGGSSHTLADEGRGRFGYYAVAAAFVLIAAWFAFDGESDPATPATSATAPSATVVPATTSVAPAITTTSIATPTTTVTTSSSARPKPIARPRIPPRPIPKPIPKPKPKAKADICKTSPFIIKDGVKHPRPECL